MQKPQRRSSHTDRSLLINDLRLGVLIFQLGKSRTSPLGSKDADQSVSGVRGAWRLVMMV